jgi:hypothetical protein
VAGLADDEVDFEEDTKDDLFPQPMGGGAQSSDPVIGTDGGSQGTTGVTGHSTKPSGSQLSSTGSGSFPASKYEKHHIVERNQAKKSGFSMVAIDGCSNLVSLPREVHRKISGFYSSKPLEYGGLRVRDWLVGQSFEDQYAFGWSVIEWAWEAVYGE